MRLAIKILLLLTLLPSLAFADMSEPPATKIANDIKIGVLLPVSNKSLNEVTQPLINAAVLAIYNYDTDPIKSESNIRGLYDARYIKTLKIYDTAKSIENAVDSALNDEVDILIGTISAQNSLKVKDLLDTKSGKTRVPFLSFSNNDKLASKAILTFGYRPSVQITNSIKKAIENGIYNFSIISFDDNLLQIALKSYRDASNDLKWLSLNPWEGEIKLLNKLKLDNFDKDSARAINEIFKQHAKLNGKSAIIFPDGSDALKYFSQLAGNDKNIQIIGSGLWFDAQTLDKENLYGAKISSPNVTSIEHFQLEYYKNFGTIPYISSSIAYDAVALIIALAEQSGRKELVFTDFISAKSFNGITGNFKFGLNGLVERKYKILTLNDKKFSELKN